MMLKASRNACCNGNILFNICQIVVEKITGRTCGKCIHNKLGIVCTSQRYEDCISSIYPVGFERRVNKPGE